MMKLYKAVCTYDHDLIYGLFDDEEDAAMFVTWKNKVWDCKFLVVEPFDVPSNIESVLLSLFNPTINLKSP